MCPLFPVSTLNLGPEGPRFGVEGRGKDVPSLLVFGLKTKIPINQKGRGVGLVKEFRFGLTSTPTFKDLPKSTQRNE